MRALTFVVAGLVVGLIPSSAAAESGEAMRARGEQLAKDGRYSEAIDSFKAAEKLEPRARHACLIALAYLRREMWPQAEIFLDHCETRATPADPVPEWLPTARDQLRQRLGEVNVAAVEITVVPTGLDVQLAVSSFAPDELFAPRTLHLPPGRHVIRASAVGYDDTEQAIEIVDKTPRSMAIELVPVGTRKPATPMVTTETPSPVPLVMVTSGAALVVGGVAMHVFSFRKARIALEEEQNLDVFNGELTDTFNRRRAITVGLYAAGAITIGVGIVLRKTVYKQRSIETAPQVSIQPREGGGMVTVGWSR